MKIFLTVLTITGLLVGTFFYLISTWTPGIRAPVTVAHDRMRRIASGIFDFWTALENSGGLENEWVRENFAYYFEEGFRYGRVDLLWPVLTTPIEALMEIPPDDFANHGGSFWIAWEGQTYVLQSPGPDRILDVTASHLERAFREGTVYEDTWHRWPYSPTNGVGSSGDLFRLSQDLYPVK